jgi:hypothetical protein
MILDGKDVTVIAPPDKDDLQVRREIAAVFGNRVTELKLKAHEAKKESHDGKSTAKTQ